MENPAIASGFSPRYIADGFFLTDCGMHKLLPFSVLKITFKICFQVILAGGLGEEIPRAAGMDQTLILPVLWVPVRVAQHIDRKELSKTEYRETPILEHGLLVSLEQ